MKAFPQELSALLSPLGRRVLDGKVPPLDGVLARGQGRFLATPGLLAPKAAREAAALLDRALGPHLTPLEAPIPPSATWDVTRNYEERLPKASRARTGFLDSKRAPCRAAAEACGLYAMLGSASFHAFAERLSGYPLKRKWGRQVLCYGPGDYAGPHTDHHPEEPEARLGYTDVHLSFCTRGVARQLLVWEKQGHLSEVTDVAKSGLVTAYRLPVWHLVTPLEAKPRASARARRWVLLGTFLDRTP